MLMINQLIGPSHKLPLEMVIYDLSMLNSFPKSNAVTQY